MRLDEPEQVDMVLGDGARDRGAACELISSERPTAPGWRSSGSKPTRPVRVRAGWVNDTHIRDMTAGCLDDMHPSDCRVRYDHDHCVADR